MLCYKCFNEFCTHPKLKTSNTQIQHNSTPRNRFTIHHLHNVHIFTRINTTHITTCTHLCTHHLHIYIEHKTGRIYVETYRHYTPHAHTVTPTQKHRIIVRVQRGRELQRHASLIGNWLTQRANSPIISSRLSTFLILHDFRNLI